MTKSLLDDALRERSGPLPPPRSGCFRSPGRKPPDDRKVFTSVRTDRRGKIQEAFLALACCVICFRFL